MSYIGVEESTQSGSPAELYEFTQGLQHWYLTDQESPITTGGKTYYPSTIGRDGVKLTSDILKDSLQVSLPISDTFAKQFLGYPPDIPTLMKIMTYHQEDPLQEVVVLWVGRLMGSKTSKNTVTLDFESNFTAIKRAGLRAAFEYNCRHTLYQKGCEINRELYRHSAEILTMDGLRVEVPGAGLHPDGYYSGGMLMGLSGALRFIVAHTGNYVTINRPIEGLAATQPVSIYPGCDHLISTCVNKFDNLPHFGGFPYIPGRNPFNGSVV
jgi:hypothetical protein